jgi:putative protein-disulfide isomerase
MNTRPFEIEYFYDPLCGWCYASAQALGAIADVHSKVLKMRPSGLFAGSGARTMSSIADHSWRNAQRVAQMTGQKYTAAYRDGVLRKPGALFDSTYTTRAIEAAGEIDPSLEPRMLHALQHARYVAGKDTSQAEAVAAVATELLTSLNITADKVTLAGRLVQDKDLADRTGRRMEETVERMRTFPASGVPIVLVTDGDHREVVDGADLYGGEAVVLQAIERVRSRARVPA